MKRTRITLADIADVDNLALATWKAARGKRHRPDVLAFTDKYPQNMQCLAMAILQEQVPYARYRAFYIQDPKRRLIHAACFEDRILHHAILNLAETTFERALVDSSYACRPHKGVHRAISQVQRQLRRYPWYVKVDIAAYFPQIDHAILNALLAKRFKGSPFLNLLARIIDSYHSESGKGLPIGSLTSQHFANYYLSGADRFLLEHPAVEAHTRYMDDILFFCNDRLAAKAVLEALQVWLKINRSLSLKPNPVIQRSQQGVSYCGYRVKPSRILLSRRKRQRYQHLRLTWEQAYLDGKISELELQQAYQSIHAITLHADSTVWRKQNLHLYPSIVI